MRKTRTIQEAVLTSALQNLTSELLSMKKGEKAFLTHYKTARLHAFQLEFLSKFLRKSDTANLETFERIMVLTKDIEDRLGGFNEIDEMVSYSKAHGVRLAGGASAEGHFLALRKDAYEELWTWMSINGWIGRPVELAEIQRLKGLIDRLEPLSDENLRHFAAKKLAKALRELQDNADRKSFAPKKKTGYQISEVEPKVHEARREIRKIPMYTGYLSGVFSLTDHARLKSKKARQALEHFTPLIQTPLSKSGFAQLPLPKIKDPLLLPRPFFLAITKYVSELGFAKDWAQNLERLRHAGLKGEINLNQLDLTLKDVFEQPKPFNLMVGAILEEICESQIFAALADFVEAQA